MNYELLILFILLNIGNVIIQTVKSLVTINCGKWMASIVNAVAYGLYTIVTIYLLCDLDLYLKAGIVALCNLVGVFIVKLIEEKARKAKLWKVEVTIPTLQTIAVDKELANIPHSFITLSEKHTLFNFYCATQEESKQVKDIVAKHDAKYFVSESKSL